MPVTYENFESEWLLDVLDGNPSPRQKGNRFAEKILRDWHDIDDSSAEIILCDGAGDGGIDAAVFSREDANEGLEGNTWMLVQSKFGTSFSGPDTIGIEAQKVFATLEGKRERLASLSQELVTRLRTFLENKGPKDRLEYVLATSGRLSEEELEYLENVKTLGRAKFGECFDVDHVSIETIYNRVVDAEQVSAVGTVVPLATTVASSGDILLIGATTLRNIFKFMQDYKTRTNDLDLLYEKNVRKFLGPKRKVNKGIEHTIDNHPDRFGLYNNGITIVAEEVNVKSPGVFNLVNPYIVNGCQTTKSIWAVLQRRLNSGGSSPSPAQLEWQTKLDKAVVITKIVVVGTAGDELLTETTRYTNSQNAVGEKDFISLEKDFRAWAPAFNSRYGVFLEIQRGAWEARRAFQRQNPLAFPQFSESANAFDLLKTYAAGWLAEPGIAFGKNPPFAPGGTLFTRILKEPTFGVDSLYAAFLLQQLANGYGFGRAAKTQTRGQTRYLFVMIALDLIKDVLVNNQLPFAIDDLSKAVIALNQAKMLEEVGDAAIQVVDDYLTDGNEDCLFSEPEFLKVKDLNAVLKSDKLGKGDEYFPKLKLQVSMAKKIFRRSAVVKAMCATIKDASS